MPEVFFAVYAAELTAREYCNLHGLWKARQKSAG
jgi:desulfoferrodoxin (superoxide reductase-like protein)